MTRVEMDPARSPLKFWHGTTFRFVSTISAGSFFDTALNFTRASRVNRILCTFSCVMTKFEMETRCLMYAAENGRAEERKFQRLNVHGLYNPLSRLIIPCMKIGLNLSLCYSNCDWFGTKFCAENKNANFFQRL